MTFSPIQITEFRVREWTRVHLECTDLITEGRVLFLAMIKELDHPADGHPVAWDFDLSPPKEGVDTGLFRRNGKPSPDGTLYDVKDLFHWRHDTDRKFSAFNPSFMVRHGRFFEICRELHQRCYTTMRGFFSKLDPVAGTTFANRLGPEADVLRWLAYKGIRPDSPLIGQDHRDRDTATFALDESHPGLEFEERGGKWLPIYGERDRPVLFSGTRAQFERVNGVVQKVHPEFAGKNHRVVKIEGLAPLSDEVIRTATVYFGHDDQLINHVVPSHEVTQAVAAA